MAKILAVRELKLHRNITPKRKTMNKIVMDYVTQYTLQKEYLIDINYLRRFKGVFLPIELVGERGGKIMDCYKNEEEVSVLMQKDKEHIPTKLIKVQFRKWRMFLVWLRI